MAEEMTLYGECSCGRNRYTIANPPSLSDTFSIVHDEEAEHDETHSAIKRTFTPLHAPHTKRQFCGFCGTFLTHWSEKPKGDADWVHVNLGSLWSESVEKLVDEGVFTASADDERTTRAVAENVSKGTSVPEVRHLQGAQWKEEMIDGSQLGRIKRRRGGQRSADGKSRIEWEFVEFTEEPRDAGGSTGKRKLDEIGHDRNVEMMD
ncbi:MAG: hypothetical protein Q9210_000989 [Variospora velana]